MINFSTKFLLAHVGINAVLLGRLLCNCELAQSICVFASVLEPPCNKSNQACEISWWKKQTNHILENIVPFQGISLISHTMIGYFSFIYAGENN